MEQEQGCDAQTLPNRTGIVILTLDPPDERTLDHAKIEAALSNLRGILNTNINFVTHVIKIEFDSEKLTIDEIKGKLREIQDKAKASNI